MSSGMLCRVALVRTDVSEEPGASFIRVTRIGELETTLAATSNRRTFLRSVRLLLVTASVVPSSPILVTLMKEALGSSETSVLTREPQSLWLFLFRISCGRIMEAKTQRDAVSKGQCFHPCVADYRLHITGSISTLIHF
jgi:hypothetical protein